MKRAGIFLFLISLREGYSRWSLDFSTQFAEHVGCCWWQHFTSRHRCIVLNISWYIWAETVCLSAGIFLSVTHHRQVTHFRNIHYLSLLLLSICLCCWKLYQSIVMPHWALWQSCAAVGSWWSCCYWEHFAIRTLYLAPGNNLFMSVFLTFSHQFSCFQLPQSITVPAATNLYCLPGRGAG